MSNSSINLNLLNGGKVYMKRLISLILVCICALGLTGCSVSWTDAEIKSAKSVEITCYSSHIGEDSVVYTVSDEKEVGNICNTFSLLVVKKAKITEPTEMSYTLRFLDSTGTEIESVNLLFGYNVVQCNGQLYKITDEMDINRYIREDVLADIQN